METLLSVVRAIILIGAVFFSFLLLFFGFHIVVREYRMLRTRKQIEEFLRMTNEAGLQADATKGTISLSRTRPGILLVGIGAVLLIVCVLQPFVYESTSQSAGGNWVQLPTRAERQLSTPQSGSTPVANPTPREMASPLQDQAQKHTPLESRYRPVGVTSVPPVGRGADSQVSGLSKVTAVTVEALRRETLDRWLTDVDRLKGKQLGEQAELLRQKYGDEAVGFDSLMLDKQATVLEIADLAYGDVKYVPLLRMSNPQLPSNESSVPAYQNIHFLQPLLALSAPSTSTTRTLMRITAGESKVQLYDTMLNWAEQAMQSTEYKSDAVAWWNQRGGLPEFQRGLYASTGRKWMMRFYKPEENESPEIVAKILYGNAKYTALLNFFNYDKPTLFANNKEPFPPGTELKFIYLSEF